MSQAWMILIIKQVGGSEGSTLQPFATVAAAVVTAVFGIITGIITALVSYYLGRAREERQVRYSRLHDRRAEILAEIYRLLLDIQDAIYHWSSALPVESGQTNQGQGEGAAQAAEQSTSMGELSDAQVYLQLQSRRRKVERLGRRVRQTVVDFDSYWRPHTIWLDPTLAETLKGFSQNLSVILLNEVDYWDQLLTQGGQLASSESEVEGDEQSIPSVRLRETIEQNKTLSTTVERDLESTFRDILGATETPGLLQSMYAKVVKHSYGLMGLMVGTLGAALWFAINHLANLGWSNGLLVTIIGGLIVVLGLGASVPLMVAFKLGTAIRKWISGYNQ